LFCFSAVFCFCCFSSLNIHQNAQHKYTPNQPSYIDPKPTPKKTKATLNKH
jgi:hypothetical protein